MTKKGVRRVDGGWVADDKRFYTDPKPEGNYIPAGSDPLGRRRFVMVPPPPGRFDVPANFTILHAEKGGKVYFVIQPGYWAGNAWHVPRRSSPLLYNGLFSNTINWGYVDGPRVIFPYGVIYENGSIKVIDVQADAHNAMLSPYARRLNSQYATPMSPSEAASWYQGAPLNYNSNTFVVPYHALWDLLNREVRLLVQKYDPSTQETYTTTVTLVSAGNITFSTQSVSLVKYNISADGTVDLSSHEPLGTIQLPVASFSGSFTNSYSNITESYLYKQSFTAYPGFRFTYVGAYYADGDYYHMPSGYAFIEFGVLVSWDKIYDYQTGNTIYATYDYYRIIDESSDVTYSSGYVDEDISVAHEPFLSFVPLSLSNDLTTYEATIAPTTTPMATNDFPNAYLFPILGETNFISLASDSNNSTAWPHYFSCSTGCTLPLSSYPVGKSIANTKVKRIIARRQGETTTYYKEIPYDFPTISNTVYIDGMRYGPGGGYDDTFVITAFAPLSSGISFSCVLPPLSPHPYNSLSDYATQSKTQWIDQLPPTLDVDTINVALGTTPIYTGSLGTIPRPLSGQTGQFMGVNITASTPFALAAVRMPSDPNKIWGLLIQNGMVRVWLWDGVLLSNWSKYPLSADGTLDISLIDWLVAPEAASVALSDNYDPYGSWGSGLHANELAQLIGRSPLSLDMSPVMMGNYLLPGWPFETDYVGFDYQYKDYQDSVSTNHIRPTLNYAFLSGVSTYLLLVHVAYVDIEKQGAMPGAQKRVPVVPVFATFAEGGT